jgi:hypothetical protein
VLDKDGYQSSCDIGSNIEVFGGDRMLRRYIDIKQEVLLWGLNYYRKDHDES